MPIAAHDPSRPVSDGPPSYGQEQLWFLEQLAPGLPTYHTASAHHLSGVLVLPRLRAALDGVVARYESLRATFHADLDHSCSA